MIDGTGKGGHSLFLRESPQAFRILRTSGGSFRPEGPAYPSPAGAPYSKALVGDLLNDRFADVVILGEQGSLLFNFGTNGTAVANPALGNIKATDGLLIDLDFTGKLDLVALTASNELRLFRQMGPLRFVDVTSTFGIPTAPGHFRSVTMENWNRDENMDLIASRADAPPLLLEKQRGGPLAPHSPAHWVSGSIIAAGDFDNDLRADLAILSEGKITLCFNGGEIAQVATGISEDVR